MHEAAGQQKTEKELKAEKTRQVAIGMYSNEKWEFLEEGIYIAKSRMPQSAEQINILNKELIQARILVKRGSTVYFLPESEYPVILDKKYPDAVVDGIIVEFKFISGNERKIKEKYKAGRKKADNVYLYFEPPFTHKTVTAKLSGTIQGKGYTTGLIWIYYSQSGKFVSLPVKDLIQKKPV